MKSKREKRICFSLFNLAARMCLYADVANIDKLVLKSRFLQSYGIAFYRLIW